MNRDGDGEPLGIAIYLSADLLRELGVRVSDASAVEYGVENGEFVVEGQ